MIARWIVMGAGAVGGAIGGALYGSGVDVVLVADGAHLDALRRRGLRLRTPATDETLPVPTVASVNELSWRAGDAVLLSVVARDVSAAVEELAAVAHTSVPIVCVQNGVDAERVALRRFESVYGVFVWCLCEHLHPGLIDVFGEPPIMGVLDVGRWPRGVDRLAEEMAAQLTEAGFASVPIANSSAMKYAKLLGSLWLGLDLTIGPGPDSDELNEGARAEARACFAAAAVDVASLEAVRERVQLLAPASPIAGHRRVGDSSLQNLIRGTSKIETHYLNGEIALLGRLHGVPTPVNLAIQAAAQRIVAQGLEPQSLSRSDLCV